MSSNLGTITYGDFSILPGYDTSSAGFGNLVVAGTSLLAGPSTSVSGAFDVTGTANLSSTLTVAGSSTFNAAANFNNSVNVAGTVTLTNVDDATDSNTGSLQVKGGLGVSLSTYLGGILDVSGATTLHDTLSVTGGSTFTGVVNITNTTETTDDTSGALTVAGGLGVGGNIRSGAGALWLAGHNVLNCSTVDGAVYLNSPVNDLFINDAGSHDVVINRNSSANFKVADALNVSTAGVQVLTDADSSTVTDGALVVAGGAAVGKTLNVGGDINAPVERTLTIGSAVLTSDTQSTSIESGSFRTAGGVGIAKNVHVGGNLDVASTADASSFLGNFRFTTSTAGANWLQSGDLNRTSDNWTPLKFAPLESTDSIMTVNSDGLVIDVNTASTSSTTGSLVVNGGVGISGDIHVGSTAHFGGVTNFNDNLWLNNHYLYLGNHDDQSSGIAYSSDAGGPLLFGSNGGALGTTTDSLKIALSWDSSQGVQVNGLTETSSSTTGALTVAGGVGIAKSLWVGDTVNVQGTSWTSTGTDVYINAGGSNINLRSNANDISGEFESTLTAFNFRTVNVTDPVAIAPFPCLVIDKITGHVSVRQTDDASGENTGSLQAYGGASVSKSLWVGGDATITGNLAITGSISTTGDSPVTYSNTTDSTSTTTGSMVLAGGMGVAKSVFIGGRLVITNTTESTDPTTGSVVIGGGLGVNSDVHIGGNSSIGGDLTVTGNITSTAGTVSFTDVTPSTSTTTGTVVVGGGVGIGGAIYVGGPGHFVDDTASTSVTTGSIVTAGGVGIGGGLNLGGALNIVDATESTSTTTGSLITAGGVGIGANLHVGGDSVLSGSLTVSGDINSTGTVTFTNDLDSTSPTDGSVVFMGGVGIAKSLFVGSPNNSADPSSGGLVVSGGLGVAQDVFVGGNQTLSGTNPILTFNNSGLAAPTFNTRSIGTKILLHAVGGTDAADFGIGMDANVLWNSIPTNASSQSFKWYGGTTTAMTLDGQGTLTVHGTSASTSSTSGSFQVSGGAGIAGSLFVGSAVNVTGTAYFGGAVTANTNVTAAGLLSVTNTTNSSDSTVGAITTSGGLGVALSVNIGQNLGVTGNTNLTGNLVTAGTITSNNATESTSSSNGSAIFKGGVGIAKSLNVGGQINVAGSTTINGNLYVNGARTFLDTQVVSMADNVLLLNSGPAGSASSGMGMKRFQLANDAGEGDVVLYDNPEITGTAQGDSTTDTIILGTDASSVDGWYAGAWILITGGTGVGQARRIKSYTGTTRTATIYTSADQAELGAVPVEGMDWTTLPDATSTYSIFTSQYVLAIWDEVNNEYAIGSSATNPVSSPDVPIRNRIRVHAGGMRLSENLEVDTINSYNPDAGTTVEGVLHKAGAVSGVTSLNGGTLPVTESVTLVDNDSAATAVIPGTEPHGSYIVLVSDVNNSGASAAFLITGATGRGGSVFRAAATAGANNEHLTVSWVQGDRPRLQFMQPPNNPNGTTYSYRVKTTSQ
jgi:hypothetical protein